MTRRVTLELRLKGRWRVIGDVHDGERPASLTVTPGRTLTFGFFSGRALVWSSEPGLVTSEVQVVDLGELLASLDEGPWLGEVHREGNVVPVRLRLEETS